MYTMSMSMTVSNQWCIYIIGLTKCERTGFNISYSQGEALFTVKYVKL